MQRLLALSALLLRRRPAPPPLTRTRGGEPNANANATRPPRRRRPRRPDAGRPGGQGAPNLGRHQGEELGRLRRHAGRRLVIWAVTGAATKAAMLEDIKKKYDLTEYTLFDFRCQGGRRPRRDHVHRSEKSSYDGEADLGQPSRASSAWVNRGGKWLAAYHRSRRPWRCRRPRRRPQPRRAPRPRPRRPPRPRRARRNRLSHRTRRRPSGRRSQAKTPMPPSASYLLPDAVEVEPEGSWTRPPQSNDLDVRRLEVSLSDFKETKIDTDATLLPTRPPAPNEARNGCTTRTWNNAAASGRPPSSGHHRREGRDVGEQSQWADGSRR